MALSKENKERRDRKVLERYRQIRKKNPRYTIVSIIEEVAFDTFLSTTTVTNIIKKNGWSVPDAKTVAKYAQPTYCQYTLF
jgi:hypothetical protein